MPASVVLSAIYGSTFMAAAALGAVGYAVATFAINLVATAVISSIIAKRAAKGASDQAIKQIGTRTQVPPSTDNKIGVVYGSAFMKPIIIDAKISTDQKKMWYVMVFSEAMDSDSIGTFSFGDIYWGDKKLNFDSTDQTKVVSWTGSDGTTEDQPNGLINVYLYRDGSSVPVNTTQTAIQVLQDSEIAEANRWDSTKLMSKLVFAVVKIQYDQEKGITGIAEITAQINNSLSKPGSVIKDYLTNTRYGAGLSLSKVNTTKLAELDAYSDETISYTPSGGGAAQTMPRYRINGPVDTTQNFLANLVDMADAADSWVQWNEAVGQWSVVINRSYLDTDPTSAGVRQVNSNNIVGGVDLTPIDLNETYNSVEIQFPNTKIKDQPGYHYIDISEFPNIVRNANEPDNRLSVALPYTNNIVQAQYIAARRLLQSREDLTINFTMDYSGIQIDAGDVIGIHHERYGWGSYNELVSQPYGKLFRVTQVQESKAADGSLYARIFASEYNDDVYDDNNIDLADFTPSLNTGISDPTVITTPATPTITDINNVGNIPNFTVNVVIPSTGTTVGMEFWYGTEESLDSGTYRLYELELPVGQTSFTKGSTLSIRFTGLDTDTYYIRCRAVGVRSKSAFSDFASVGWEPTFISGVVGQDISVQFTPPSLAVPRIGPNLVPQYTGVRLRAYGNVGGALLGYSGATSDADSRFTSNSWRIGNTANNSFTNTGVVTATNVAFTLTQISTTTDGGVIFPEPYAMNSQTAVVTIPVRFKDAAGNIFQSAPASAQLFFQDQGATGPAGEDGINPGFIDLTVSGGSFRLGTDTITFTPSSIVVRVTEQNILNPIPLWSVTGASYVESTNSFTNDTITLTPYTTSSQVTVRVDVDLYSKSVNIPIIREIQGPQGIPGSFAGRGFIPLAYVPIGVDPTLASQAELTAAWTSATTYTPILNDGGTFWYEQQVDDGLGNITINNITENFTYNGTQWIAAIIQVSGNLIADGTITANQMNANSIFTNRLASTNNVNDFGSNTGPGYWLDGSDGSAYFGGSVSIGQNLNVEGLITAATLIARVVDTDTIVPGAVTEGQRAFFEGSLEVDYVNPTNGDGTAVWSTGTRGFALPLGVSITPKISAADGGRIFLDFSTTIYNNSGDTNKNLVELWRAGNVINSRRFKKLYNEEYLFNYSEWRDQSAVLLSNPNPLGTNHYVRLYNHYWNSDEDYFIEGDLLSGAYNWKQAISIYSGNTSTDAVNYLFFDDLGNVASTSPGINQFNAFLNNGTLPTVTYGRTIQYNVAGIESGDWGQDMTAMGVYPIAYPKAGYDMGREIFISDANGQIYYTNENKLITVKGLTPEYRNSPGQTKPKINKFAFTFTTQVEDVNQGLNYAVIGVGNNGRIIRSARDHRSWFSTRPRSSPTIVGEYDIDEFTWTEYTAGSYNLNGVASNYNIPSREDGSDPLLWTNGQRLVAVGDFGTIYYSNDHGKTWTKAFSGTTDNLLSVSARPLTTSPQGYMWFVVGESGRILRSTNGIDWESSASIGPQAITTETTYTPNLYETVFLNGVGQYPFSAIPTDAVVVLGDDRVFGVPATTSTATTSLISITPQSGVFYRRLWYLGSNSSPFVNTTASVASRLIAPSDTVSAVITDTNYIADYENGLTYVYYLVVGNMSGSTPTFVTNPYIAVTEFKR